MRFARSAKFTKIFEKKKCVSIDSKCSETRKNAKKKIYPFDRIRASCVAQSASGEVQPYLPHVTRRVPRSVHAKFHADWTKTVGARGIQTNKQTNRQTNRQSYFNYIDYLESGSSLSICDLCYNVFNFLTDRQSL